MSQLPIGTLLLFILCAYGQEMFGDKCTHKATNQTGTCRFYSGCLFAIQENFLDRSLTQRCSSEPSDETICCPRVKDEIPSEPVAVISGLSTKMMRFPACRYVRYGRGDSGGGKKALGREFPHMAAIGYENKQGQIIFGCGGSLINERYILTAAHCLHTKDFGKPKYVRLGDLNINSDKDDAQPQNFTVSEVIPHPDYDPPQSYHDIGLIKLDRDAVFNEYVKPACLESATFDMNGTDVSATGWGQTKFLGSINDHLIKVYLEVYPMDECKRFYPVHVRKLPKGVLQEVQLCAGFKYSRRDTCRGDSGGPLQILSGDTYTVVGVTSFGKACMLTAAPGVYTRVSPYVNWIRDVVLAPEDSTSDPESSSPRLNLKN